MPPQRRSALAEMSENIVRSNELTPYQRGLIVGASDWGAKPMQLSHITHIPPSTIKRTINKAAIRDNKGNSLPRSGRPKKIEERDKRRILREVRTHPKQAYKATIQHLSLDITHRTLSRFLDIYNIKKWRAAKRPKLTREYAIQPLQWAIDHVDWTSAEWARMIFSDECSVERGVGKECVWVFRTPSRKWDKEIIEAVPKGKQISVIIWVGINLLYRRSPIVIIQRDEQSPRGGYSVYSYMLVLEDGLLLIYHNGLLFQQDNARIHTAIVTRE
jgi:transposase